MANGQLLRIKNTISSISTNVPVYHVEDDVMAVSCGIAMTMNVNDAIFFSGKKGKVFTAGQQFESRGKHND